MIPMDYRIRDLAGEGESQVAGDLLLDSGKKRVHILALGDVGSTVLMGLYLLGADCVEHLGIYDLHPELTRRLEAEMNQMSYPWDYERFPRVEVIKEEQALFACDVLVFCASKHVPLVGEEAGDVRMAQLKANSALVAYYAQMAKEKGFKGLFAVVSDPVDQLCQVALSGGLLPEQIEGYGLGVMNSRAAYFAKQDPRFQSFLQEGRAFGPHGKDLVIANSVHHYDDALSKELTKLAIGANLQIRGYGYKPFLAPAISSGAIPLLLTLRGEWHYSATYLGGVFMGAKNRRTRAGIELENLSLPEALYRRIEVAYQNLKRMS